MTEPLFRRLADDEQTSLTVFFDGQPIVAREGETVAAALLAAGIDSFRTTPVRQVPRGPHCMIGACFDCLLRIDGEANRQGCMTPVRQGMQVEAMEPVRSVGDANG